MPWGLTLSTPSLVYLFQMEDTCNPDCEISWNKISVNFVVLSTLLTLYINFTVGGVHTQRARHPGEVSVRGVRFAPRPKT